MLSHRFKAIPRAGDRNQLVTLMSRVVGPLSLRSPSKQNGAATAPQATVAGMVTNPNAAAGENNHPNPVLKLFDMPLPKSAKWWLPGSYIWMRVSVARAILVTRWLTVSDNSSALVDPQVPLTVFPSDVVTLSCRPPATRHKLSQRDSTTAAWTGASAAQQQIATSQEVCFIVTPDYA